MFRFSFKKPQSKPISQEIVDSPLKTNVNVPIGKPKFKIPYHFQKNNIVTYSQSQIKKELKKYPGLLKTLGHAYQYQIVFLEENKEKQYWFCRNLEILMPLLKYLKGQNWTVDWQEKPFILYDLSSHY